MPYEPTPEDWLEYEQWCKANPEPPPENEEEPEARPAHAPLLPEEPPW